MIYSDQLIQRVLRSRYKKREREAGSHRRSVPIAGSCFFVSNYWQKSLLFAFFPFLPVALVNKQPTTKSYPRNFLILIGMSVNVGSGFGENAQNRLKNCYLINSILQN